MTEPLVPRPTIAQAVDPATEIACTLATPADWVRVRLRDDATRDADLVKAARAATRGRSDRDRLVPLVAELLRDAVTAHAVDHTVEVHLPLPRPGIPLACALAVTVLPPELAPDEPPVEAGQALETVLLSCGPVQRVVGVQRTELPSGHGSVDSQVLQYHRQAPDGRRVVLSFSTPLLEILEPLTALFDAVAGSLRWPP